MKKFLVLSFAAILTMGFSPLFAQSVNESELKSAGSEDIIVFENYAGPHSKIESASAIRSIGTGLASRLKSAGMENSSTQGNGEKYSVIHAVDSTAGKLDADIIILSPQASVDHIKNLRRIISAYLAEAYGYSERDASTIATFVTVYNAVYRKNMDMFRTKYKDIVTSNLSEEKCGLSVKWNEWPGASQIVIPLGEYAEGGLSAIDTSVISDSTVVKSMQEDDDRGIDERKNMVDIKEREADLASEKAQQAAKDAAQDKSDLAQAKKDLAEADRDAQAKQSEADKAMKDADAKQAEADEALRAAEADPNNKELRKKAEEKQKEADEARKVAEQKQKEADEAKAKAEKLSREAQELSKQAEESQAKATEQQKKSDRKNDEAQSERREIARDQQELTEEEIKNAKDGTVIGLKLVDAEKGLSTLVKINARSGKVVRESEVKVIRGRNVIEVQDSIKDIATGASMPSSSSESPTLLMAICGEEKGNGAVKLCLIDTYNMQIQKESNENVSKDSVLVSSASSFYVVINEGGQFHVAKYDRELNLIARSAAAVHELTPITITSKGIMVTSDKNKVLLLSLTDLNQISE
ncbi:MAG: hypothetical protein MJZ50_06500 [Treponema sp.]|nr:hypothetical protein [Treponema sp.]